MIMFTISVDTTGTGSHARLATDESAEHCVATPRVRGLRRYVRDSDNRCLATHAAAAIEAARRLLDGYAERVDTWRLRECQCEQCVLDEGMEPLFDLVRSTPGRA